MSYASRNNGKITSRNQGGGTKLQGLGPTSTSYYIANKNASTYYSEVGDGSNNSPGSMLVDILSNSQDHKMDKN